MYYPDDTIVAISSAPGPAARGVIRLSGPQALTAVAELFRPDDKKRSLPDALPWTRLTGRCRLTDNITSPAQVYLFRAPHTYTTQDIAELHLPGSPPLLQIVLEQLLTADVRPAEPGEFTARAFFNSRLDLTEAQAVAALINARSDAQLRAAERLLDGALHCSCAALVARLTETLALVETAIDFAEEDIDFAAGPALRDQICAAAQDTAQLLTDSTAWDQLDHLPRVAVLGRPNVGKSTLTNALTGLDRSIVSAIAGTTRDMLTAPLRLTHGECLLIDTAGLADDTSDLSSPADVFAQTQIIARRAAATCDLLLWVFDLSADASDPRRHLPDDITASTNIIFVGNKIDLLADASETTALPADIAPVSALTGRNLSLLKARIEHTLRHDLSDCQPSAIALTTRQRDLLDHARQALQRASDLFDALAHCQPELVALELRTALDHLGGISGQVVTEDILTNIFSRFCIGK